jgi:hypothetical protein
MFFHPLLTAAALLAGPPAPPADRPVDEPAARPAPNLHPKPPAPVAPEKIDSGVRRGVEFLLADQNKDGSWGTPSLKGGVPIIAGIGTHHAFGAAVTSLVVSALIETGGDSPEVRRAIERGEAFLFAELPKARRDNPMLISSVWAYAYGIEALVRMHGRLPADKDRQKRIEDLIRGLHDRLGRDESAEGGWGYYDFDAGTAAGGRDLPVRHLPLVPADDGDQPAGRQPRPVPVV